MVTVPFESTVAIWGLKLVNDTGKPEVAFASNEKLEDIVVFVGIGANEIF